MHHLQACPTILSLSLQNTQEHKGLVHLTPKAGRVPDGKLGFCFSSGSLNVSELRATSLSSVHSNVTKYSANDSSKAEEEDIGQVGKLPADTLVSDRSHSAHYVPGVMTLQ